MYHTIPYKSGRIAILSDQHVDSYERADSDFVTSHGLTPAFHSDMTEIIETFAPDAWFFGHSHRRLRAMVGGTDVRNVSVGYAREFHLS